MKLIINIDEKAYKDGQLCNFFRCYSKKLDEIIYNGIPIKELDENPCLTCGNNCCNHKECEYHNLIILKENKK